MPSIKHQIYIKAPVEVCFDLARSIEVHMNTTAQTDEKAVGKITTGLLEFGDSVTWEATHFCVRQRLTAKIIEMQRPTKFTDVMLKGAFHSFLHSHEFVVHGEGTMMTDTFEYKSPFGIVGKLADVLFLEKYMRNFIVSRAEKLKEIAEIDLQNPS